MESTSFRTFPLGSSTTKSCATPSSPHVWIRPPPLWCPRPAARLHAPGPLWRGGSGSPRRRVLAGGLLRFGQTAYRSLRPRFDAGEVDHRDLIVQGDLATVDLGQEIQQFFMGDQDGVVPLDPPRRDLGAALA